MPSCLAAKKVIRLLNMLNGLQKEIATEKMEGIYPNMPRRREPK
jgi:hypothetical protein